MVNWRVDPEMLQPLVPRGTVLDPWNGAHWVSLVGFLFRRTRVLGIPIPLHRDFEEINLRFYVRRTVGSDVRRGVCFIRELVPRAAIAVTARLAYNEPYVAVPMAHHIEPADTAPEASRVAYSWRMKGTANRIEGEPVGRAAPVVKGSHEEFITEHYWGYTRQRSGGTIEYRVEHPSWTVRHVPRPRIDGDPSVTYGDTFGAVMRAPPASTLLADGSPVTVYRPVRIA